MLEGGPPVHQGELPGAFEHRRGAGIAQAARGGHAELEAQALGAAEAGRSQVLALHVGPAFFAQGGEQQFLLLVGAQAGPVPGAVRGVAALAAGLEHVLLRPDPGDQVQGVQRRAIDGPGLLPRALVACPVERGLEFHAQHLGTPGALQPPAGGAGGEQQGGEQGGQGKTQAGESVHGVRRSRSRSTKARSGASGLRAR